MSLRDDARSIAGQAIAAVTPQPAVRQVLEGRHFPGRVYMVAIGKAAYAMAESAAETLGESLTEGIVITKYGHGGETPIPRTAIHFAGHPLPDENTVGATDAAIGLVRDLRDEDTVLLLISGGGSALFESPVVPLDELADISRQLLASGANIGEINTIRKRLSTVKAGRFADMCKPAHVLSIVLSDVLVDRLDVIASGPATADSSTCGDALAIAERYHLRLSPGARAALNRETPKVVHNVESHITGSVRHLCEAAAQAARARGYEPLTLTHELDCEAREAGAFLGAVARHYHTLGGRWAIIAGGETVVHLTGDGLGGRNQELAFAATRYLDGLVGALLLSVGSDGTDGPTDAAGGIADGGTAGRLRDCGIGYDDVLLRNDSYRALVAVGDLIITGPTGTNVNDLTLILIDREEKV